MDQRPGCYVAAYAPGNIADNGLLCKNMAFTRARVVSSNAPTNVIDAWVTHAGMDCLKSFNAPQDQFTRHWRLNLFERPENLAYELAPYALAVLMDQGFSDEPHFRSKTQHRGNVAMTVATLRSRLNTAAAANNLPGSSMSCLRRDFTQHVLTMVERHSVEVLIGHRQRQATRDKRYGRGSAGIDVARLRLDEVEAPHAYRNELMLKDLEERAWQGFAMHTLGLSRGGGDKCTELDDDADANHLGLIRAAKGASAQKKPYRTLDVSVQSLGAKYDVVRKAGKEMQAALDRVQLATKVEIAIDNWMLKNLKKLAAEPYVSTSHAAKKAVGATLSAHSDVTDALALARNRENAPKGKEKRPTFGATTVANVYDAAAATDVMKERAGARSRAIKRFDRKRQSSDEELGKASPYLLSIPPRYKQLSDKIQGLTRNSVSASDLASMSARIDDLEKAMEARSTAHNELRTLAAKSTDVEQLRGWLFQLIDSYNQHRTQYKATVESLHPLLSDAAETKAAGAQPQDDHGEPQARVEPTGGKAGNRKEGSRAVAVAVAGQGSEETLRRQRG